MTPSTRAQAPSERGLLHMAGRFVLVSALAAGIAGLLYWAVSQTYPFRWNRAMGYLEAFNEALLITLQVSLIGFVIGLVLGLVVALSRLGLRNFQPAPLPAGASFLKVFGSAINKLIVTLLHDLSLLYVHTIRNIPFLVLVLFMYFGVGRAVIAPGQAVSLFGMPIDERILWGSLALGIFEASFISEIFRAGIESIHKAQMEAAKSLGMGYVKAMRYVVLPQAFRTIIPPLTGETIALVKESALLTIISLGELTHTAQELGSRTLLQFEFFLILAGYYLAITVPLSLISHFLEKRLNVHRGKA